MKINIFEGGRRLSKLCIGVWIACVAAFSYLDAPYIHDTLKIAYPGATPQADSDCKANDVKEYIYRTTNTGKDISITLCFASQLSNDNRYLVPFKVEGGQYWMGDAGSPPVAEYTRSCADHFSLSAEQSNSLDTLWWHERLDELLSGAKVSLIGSVALWGASLIVGWIVRGFIGVPRGNDFRDL